MIFLKVGTVQERSSSREPQWHPAPTHRALPLAATTTSLRKRVTELTDWCLCRVSNHRRLLSVKKYCSTIVWRQSNSLKQLGGLYRGQKPYQKARRRRKKCHIVIHQANVDPPPGGVGGISKKVDLVKSFNFFSWLKPYGTVSFRKYINSEMGTGSLGDQNGTIFKAFPP